MDRPIIYPLEVPDVADLLYGWQRTMVALSKLAQATLGSGSWMAEFPVTPGAGLSVNLGPCQAFTMADVDAAAYSSLPVDTTQILKQYLLEGSQNFPLAAPTTSGNAINYLLQITPVDEDEGNTVLQYFDPADPNVAFGGPNNSGASQATQRVSTLQVQLISGSSAPAGSQPTPVMTGIAGVVITVTAGQTSITTSNIVPAEGSAPVVTQRLPYAAVTNANNNFTAPQTFQGNVTVSGATTLSTTNVPDATSNSNPTAFGQFSNIISTGGYQQLFATDTTLTSSVAFTAPCNGVIFATGSRNNSVPAASENLATLYINGVSMMSDNTTLTTSHSGTVSVTAGTVCTIEYIAAAVVPFSCTVAAVFIPSSGGSL